MAATATQQIINNSSRNLVLKYTIAGTTGDTSDGVLVDVSALDSSIGVNDLKLKKVKAVIHGFSVRLAWDATANVDLIDISDGDNIDLCYSEFGGIPNNAGSGATGDVLWTTTGYTASGDGGHIILWFTKQ